MCIHWHTKASPRTNWWRASAEDGVQGCLIWARPIGIKALHWELDQWLVTNLVKCFSSTTFLGDQIVCTWDRMGMFIPTASWNVKLTETHRYFETFCNKTHQQNTYFQSSVAQKSTTESYCFSTPRKCREHVHQIVSLRLMMCFLHTLSVGPLLHSRI